MRCRKKVVVALFTLIDRLKSRYCDRTDSDILGNFDGSTRIEVLTSHFDHF